MFSNISYLWLVFSGIGFYLILRTIYRLYFHPLRKIPGPKSTAITHAYKFYYDFTCGGQLLFQIEKMHQQYGLIVRINPREVHVNDPMFYDEIYASSTRVRDKDPFSSLNAPSRSYHLHVKKSYRVTHFLPYRPDIITYYCFGKSWKFIEEKTFCSDIRTAVSEATALVHPNRFIPWIIHLPYVVPSKVMFWLQPGSAALFKVAKAIFDQIMEAMQNGIINEALRLSYGLLGRLPRVVPDETLQYKGHIIPPGVRMYQLPMRYLY
ncbi:benzoate 4-monooxygenase cytochrome P450 [Penicillium concentricum]|uniref:Benzoate 4-monooxygenase cytochrome P450 n=1 Tax=Penicillium concentricum TaxID=293559 RepID=A0A9W9V9W6_9EURO|nr:benzoate 4-monooxygenase cytochrome P450 [Penicillium concentricum]KAJ5374187.1 benzoate 4-monooxygenase cytochrome P450 [Penicillium concentricum]